MNIILCEYHWTGCNALERLLEKKLIQIQSIKGKLWKRLKN